MMQPSGVQGVSAGRPVASRPALIRVQAVDILGRIDRRHDLCGRAIWLRQLHQDAVHRRIAVELADQREQVGLRDVCRQHVLERGHAGGERLLALAADVDFARRIVTDQHHARPGVKR